MSPATVRCLAVAAALAAATSATADPHVDYMIQCQGCHLADGAGKPDAVPSLVGNLGRFLAVPGGREFLVRVPGSSTSPLDDDALADVLNWMIRTFDPGAAELFEPYTAEEVARVRKPPLADVGPLRRRLLEAGGEND